MPNVQQVRCEVPGCHNRLRQDPGLSTSFYAQVLVYFMHRPCYHISSRLTLKLSCQRMWLEHLLYVKATSRVSSTASAPSSSLTGQSNLPLSLDLSAAVFICECSLLAELIHMGDVCISQ